MTRQRQREYIIRDILETTMTQPVSVSQINLHVGLTSMQTKEYIGYLLGKGLVREVSLSHPHRLLYKCTPRGVRFLGMIKTISALLQPEDELPKMKN